MSDIASNLSSSKVDPRLGTSEGAVEKEELLEELLLEKAPGLKPNIGRCIQRGFPRLRLCETARCECVDRIFWLKVRGG